MWIWTCRSFRSYKILGTALCSLGTKWHVKAFYGTNMTKNLVSVSFLKLNKDLPSWVERLFYTEIRNCFIDAFCMYDEEALLGCTFLHILATSRKLSYRPLQTLSCSPLLGICRIKFIYWEISRWFAPDWNSFSGGIPDHWKYVYPHTTNIHHTMQ